MARLWAAKSTQLSLIVCRSIGDMAVFNCAWIFARALARMYAVFVRRRAGARRITPIAPASTGPMSAISSEGEGTRRSQSSRSSRGRWRLSQGGYWTEASRFAIPMASGFFTLQTLRYTGCRSRTQLGLELPCIRLRRVTIAKTQNIILK